jgi:NADPH:quinone reductase
MRTSSVQAICVNSFGGPEVFTLTTVDRPVPGATQVLVQVTVAGVNYLDVYQRTGVVGLFPVVPPYLAGVEGVGVVVEVGSAVTDLSEGQRVGWLNGGQGSFADYVAVEAARAVPIPDDVEDESAAAVLMQGVTAQYLATDTYAIRPGDPVLVHAAAGGVGQLLVQVAKLRGGMVIGTVSTEAKAEVARAAGADHVISYDNFAARVRELTGGHGVAAVWRSLGSTRAEGCTSPGLRSVTTPRPPKSSAAAQTTSSAGWPREISRSTSAAATRSRKSGTRLPHSRPAGLPANFYWFLQERLPVPLELRGLRRERFLP